MFFEKRAQVATENLVIVVVFMAVVAILSGFSFLMVNETIKIGQADNAAKSLASLSNQVSGMGGESRLYAEITVPDNISGAYAVNNSIVYSVESVSGTNDVSGISKNSISYTLLPSESGRFVVSAELSDGNVVFNWG
jgi:hypothetical protein